MNRWYAGLVLVVLLASLGAALVYEYQNPIPADAVATYVGGNSCIDCHQEQHSLFHGSHHDFAMDVANDETVLAKFDGSTIEHFGITSRMFKTDDKFMVHTEGPDGEMRDFEVKMVFGYEPLQQYMVELNPSNDSEAMGQYQVLRISWDVQKQEWFYLTPPDVNEKLAPDDPLHWTGISQRWNTNCAICHSTNLQKNFNTLTGKYSTTFTDIDVNCESCHGPGSLHVQIANKRRFFWDKNHGLGLANNLKTTDNVPQVETCAPCHSRRTEICNGHQAGNRFNDHFACQLLSPQIYHDDGQIRDEDYVYGSFIQSKMYHQGIKCTDCHDPHSAKVKFDDNQLCTSCHQHPAGKYDTPSHHRHKTGSAGALCVECHMPATTYMAVDSRRDHSLRVPRPDVSVAHGTPNACTACHVDENRLPPDKRGSLTQYLDWIIAAENGDSVIGDELERVDMIMATAFKEWYPDAATNKQRSQYYEQLVLGKSNDKSSLNALMGLAKTGSAPAIFRASAVEALTQKNDTLEIGFLRELLSDDDPKVISATLNSIDQQIAQLISTANYAPDAALGRKLADYIDLVDPLLIHHRRHVRISAARLLANIPLSLRNNGSISHTSFQKALDEYKDSLRIGSDLAANHMILGSLYEANQEPKKAEDAYRSAIAVEPNFAGPRSNLAALLEQQADRFRTEIIRSPQSNNNVNLGTKVDQLVANAKRLRQDENRLLARDAERAEGLTGSHGLFYRYGLSCYLMRDMVKAEKYLLKAHELEPHNETYLLGVATFYNQAKKYQTAIGYINRLIERNRNNKGYQRLRDQALQGLKDSDTSSGD